MRIRSIEASDREFFIDRCHAFYKTPACDHEIPQQNAERTFELLLHGTPYADCLIAEDENGQPCAYCLLALTWSNEAAVCASGWRKSWWMTSGAARASAAGSSPRCMKSTTQPRGIVWR